MWLDAFIPKNKNMPNIGVPGVPGVPLPRPPSKNAGFANMPERNTGKNQGVPGVPLQQAGTPGTPRNTLGKTVCSSVQTPLKASIHAGFKVCGTPGTPGTPQKHMTPEIIDTLALFQFELMEQDLAAGHTAEQLRRVNNITWRLMTAKGFTFDEAIKAAAEWVIDNEQRQDETAFADVLALYSGLHQTITKESTQ